MGMYEITAIDRKNRTGRRLGIVRASSRIDAVNFISRKFPNKTRFRVFPVRLIKRRKRKWNQKINRIEKNTKAYG